jgi:hypothetical protein
MEATRLLTAIDLLLSRLSPIRLDQATLRGILEALRRSLLADHTDNLEIRIIRVEAPAETEEDTEGNPEEDTEAPPAVYPKPSGWLTLCQETRGSEAEPSPDLEALTDSLEAIAVAPVIRLASLKPVLTAIQRSLERSQPDKGLTLTILKATY